MHINFVSYIVYSQALNFTENCNNEVKGQRQTYFSRSKFVKDVVIVFLTQVIDVVM